MFIPIGLFLFTLFFYLRTLCATFNINDSGETIMDCDTLAIAHAPGYPFHTLLGRLFCLLPLGQPMFRLTFGSALMGAFSVVVIYIVLKKTLLAALAVSNPASIPEENQWGSWIFEIPSLFGALVFAFSYQHWFQADGAKGSIYTLNTLLASMTLYLLFKMREPGWFTRSFLLLGFFLGLALSVHWETQAALLPAFFWLLVTAQNRVPVWDFFRNLLRPFDLWEKFKKLGGAFGGGSGLIRAGVFLILPLSTYLYLPLRAAGKCVVTWFDPETLQKFLFVALRGNYSMDPRSWDSIHRNLARFWLHAHDQYGAGFTLALLLLAPAGGIWLYRRQKDLALGFSLFGGSVFAALVLYTVPRAGYEWTQDNFFTPVFLMVTLFAAAGAAALCQWVSLNKPHRLIPLFLSAAFLGLALVPLELNYQANDQSLYVGSYDEGINMLKTASRGGVIICNGDIDLMPLWYLELVEGKRPDTATFTTQMVGLQWYRDDMARQWPFLKSDLQGNVAPDTAVEDLLHFHSGDHAFYTTNIYPQGAAFLWSRHSLVPDGLLWRLADTQGQAFAFNSGRVNELWSKYQLRNLDKPDRKYWDDYTDVMKDAYGQASSVTGDYAMMNRMPDVAQWSYEKAVQYHQPQALGVAYLKLADSELALSRPVDAISHYQQSFQWPMPRGYVPYAYARMGDAFLMEKDYPDADQAFRASLGLNPQQKEALDGIRQLNSAWGKS